MRAHAGHDFQLDTARHLNPVDEDVYLLVIHDQGCNPVDEAVCRSVTHDQGCSPVDEAVCRPVTHDQGMHLASRDGPPRHVSVRRTYSQDTKLERHIGLPSYSGRPKG